MLGFLSTLTNILWTQVVSRFAKPLGTVQIGEHTYGKPVILSYSTETRIFIGKFCSIGENATIVGAGDTHHRIWSVPNFPLKLKYSRIEEKETRETIIGNDVWIGTGAIILYGVKIGDGAIVGAGAVVTREMPPFSIVMGVPARVSRYRFTAKQIKELLEIAWWNWSIQEIVENIDYFDDVERFIERFSRKQRR